MSKQTDLITLTDGITTDSSGNVGIGTDSPSSYLSGNLVVGDSNSDQYVSLVSGSANAAGLMFQDTTGTSIVGGIRYTHSDDALAAWTNGAERMRIDSSGNLLVGGITTLPSSSVNGFGVLPTGIVVAATANDKVTVFKRNGSNGDISLFQQDSTTVGHIGSYSGSGQDQLYISCNDTGLKFNHSVNKIGPSDQNGNNRDNQLDWGDTANRWDDIYATNGNINTSDANEKQAIASLTAPELEAAKAISGLFKNFKWNDSVEEKGVDAARIHTGVIAQEVEQALIDAGLDAGNYAFFVSTDWVDEDTGEERNRKGIRYPQLLSFVAAATEQRLTSIEARLDLIEGGPL